VQVAGFAAFQAIEQPVDTQPHLVPSLAQAAVPVALAPIFNQIANRAAERFSHASLYRKTFAGDSN